MDHRRDLVLVDHPLQAGEIGDVTLREGHVLECLRVGDELQPPAVGDRDRGRPRARRRVPESRDPGSQTSERAGDERGGHCGIMHYPRFLCRWISTTSADAKRNAMKLATLRRPDGSLTTAVVVADEIVDLSVAAPDAPARDVGAARGGSRGTGAGAGCGRRLRRPRAARSRPRLPRPCSAPESSLPSGSTTPTTSPSPAPRLRNTRPCSRRPRAASTAPSTTCSARRSPTSSTTRASSVS